MAIFEPTLTAVLHSPADRRVALVIRHSVRYPIIDEESILTAELTPEGVMLAEDLGSQLVTVRNVRHIVTNYIKRCIDTAEALRRGTGQHKVIEHDHRLSHPFIGPVWDALPINWPQDPLPSRIVEVLELAFSYSDLPGAVDVFVTHDTIVGVLAGYLMNEEFNDQNWPNYLEGILLWRDQDELCASWRGRIKRFSGILAQ